MLKKLALTAVVAAAFGFATATSSNATVFKTYGDAYSNGSAFNLSSSNGPWTGPYGGLEMGFAGSLTLAGITQLSADYTMQYGSFAGGSPRFTLFDQALNAVYAYWGTPMGGGTFSNPVSVGTPTNTGNYADLSSTDLRFYSNGFGGLNSPNTGLTWSDLVAAVGSTDISWITLDLDGGFAGVQTMLVDNFTVNGDVFSARPRVAVPAPGTLSIFAAALAGLGVISLRRKKAQAAAA